MIENDIYLVRVRMVKTTGQKLCTVPKHAPLVEDDYVIIKKPSVAELKQLLERKKP